MFYCYVLNYQNSNILEVELSNIYNTNELVEEYLCNVLKLNIDEIHYMTTTNKLEITKIPNTDRIYYATNNTNV